jgi:LacI family transcriptional regulator
MQISPQKVSLSSVAEAAGVSAMTVSRVLRNSSKVAEKTRVKVMAAVEKLDYRPDPHMARLMAKVRDSKAHSIQSSIAVLRDYHLDVPYRFVALEDIRSRAIQHGYQAEEFFLGRDGMTAKRMRQILKARGIEGIIASPPSTPKHLLEFDFSEFSTATFGYGLKNLSLHRASTNMTQGILMAIEHLTARGYRRIGLAVTEWIDLRADQTYSGALLYHQTKIPAEDRVPPLFLPNIGFASGVNRFCDWMKAHRPDAIISFDQLVPDWIEKKLGMRIPEDVGFVVHDWVKGMEGLAGIDHRRPHVASAAVDLVATQLMHNETGIVPVPRQILIPPAFVPGTSVR